MVKTEKSVDPEGFALFLIVQELIQEGEFGIAFGSYEMGKIKNYFLAWIPGHLANQGFVLFLEGLRFCGKCSYKLLGTKRKERILLQKREELLNEERKEGHLGKQLIENQRDLWKIPYGKANIAYSGCELIAVYNVLFYFGYREERLEKIITAFEKDGILVSGHWGTSIYAMRDYLKKNCVQGEKISCFLPKKKGTRIRKEIEKEDRMEQVVSQLGKGRKVKKAAIVTFYNNRNSILDGIHTVALTFEKSGKPGLDEWGFFAHNVDGKGKCLGSFLDLNAFAVFLEERNGKVIACITIEKETE